MMLHDAVFIFGKLARLFQYNIRYGHLSHIMQHGSHSQNILGSFHIML